MLAVSHPISSALPSPHDRVMDQSGTINPAALNSSGTLRRQYCSCPAPRRAPTFYAEHAHNNHHGVPRDAYYYYYQNAIGSEANERIL